MRERRFFAIIFLTFSLLLVSDARVRAATLEQLVEGAKKERTLEFYGPSHGNTSPLSFGSRSMG